MECLVLGVEISVAVAGRMAQKEGWLVGCHREDGAMCFTERGVDFFTFDFSLALFPVIGRMDGWVDGAKREIAAARPPSASLVLVRRL